MREEQEEEDESENTRACICVVKKRWGSCERETLIRTLLQRAFTRPLLYVSLYVYGALIFIKFFVPNYYDVSRGKGRVLAKGGVEADPLESPLSGRAAVRVHQLCGNHRHVRIAAPDRQTSYPNKVQPHAQGEL